MSTLDIVNQVGGTAANFLDVGGGAGAELLANAIEVINNDPKVKAIFINIFGGITKCDEVADGIVQALGRVQLASPIVVRLDGTNAEAGRAILAEHVSETLIPAKTMLEAAEKVVELAGKLRAEPSEPVGPTDERARPSEREELSDGHLRRQGHQGRLPGPHREPGPVPRPSEPAPTAPRSSPARTRRRPGPTSRACRSSPTSPRR